MKTNLQEVSELLTGYSITTGAVLSDDYAVVACTSDARLQADPEDEHSYIARLSPGKLVLRKMPFAVRCQTALLAPEPHIISVSAKGGVRRSMPIGSANEEKIGHASGQTVFGRTMLNEIRTVGGQAFAVGTRRAVYRRQGFDVWVPFDDGTYDAQDFECGFQSIDGLNQNDLYAVGRRGEIWHFDGNSWGTVDTPTNQRLNTVAFRSDGLAVAAGAKGVILVGSGGKWRPLETVPEHLEFWSARHFDGKIFLTANTTVLFVLDGDALVPVDFGSCAPPGSAYHLKVFRDQLWCFGAKDIRVLQSGRWIEVVSLPD